MWTFQFGVENSIPSVIKQKEDLEATLELTEICLSFIAMQTFVEGSAAQRRKHFLLITQPILSKEIQVVMN